MVKPRKWLWLFVCLFVCLFVAIVPLLNFSLIWRRHHYRWRAANFDLCSAIMAIEQWEFFSVPHLLWYEASVYNGHLRGPVTLTPNAECFVLELTIPVFTTKVCLSWDSNCQPSVCGANARTHCASAAVKRMVVSYWSRIHQLILFIFFELMFLIQNDVQ